MRFRKLKSIKMRPRALFSLNELIYKDKWVCWQMPSPDFTSDSCTIAHLEDNCWSAAIRLAISAECNSDPTIWFQPFLLWEPCLCLSTPPNYAWTMNFSSLSFQDWNCHMQTEVFRGKPEERIFRSCGHAWCSQQKHRRCALWRAGRGGDTSWE